MLVMRAMDRASSTNCTWPLGQQIFRGIERRRERGREQRLEIIGIVECSGAICSYASAQVSIEDANVAVGASTCGAPGLATTAQSKKGPKARAAAAMGVHDGPMPGSSEPWQLEYSDPGRGRDGASDDIQRSASRQSNLCIPLCRAD